MDLPTAGTYTLTATSAGIASGSYSFDLDQTNLTNLAVNTVYKGSLPGNASAQLFDVNIPMKQALLVTFGDSTAADQNEIYLKHVRPHAVRL